MRRRRHLSSQEVLWVEECITEICMQEGLSPADELYRSAAWASFLAWYQGYERLWDPCFWPGAFEQVAGAIRFDKRLRTASLYRELSLNQFISTESGETFLDRLSAQNGDFTNGIAFSDFIDRLPQELRRLSHWILDDYTLEEARSILCWTKGELLSAVDILRQALWDYSAA